MAELWDIYTLAHARSPELIEQFVEELIPQRELPREPQEFALRADDQQVYLGGDSTASWRWGASTATPKVVQGDKELVVRPKTSP